jgi:hypothetical protein
VKASFWEFQDNDHTIHSFRLPDGSAWYEVETSPGFWRGANTLEEALEIANNAELIWR